MKRFVIFSLALSCFALLGCGDDSDYDPSWGDDQLFPSGKGDFLDIAEPIALGESKTGEVSNTQLDAYRLTLTAGDKFTLLKEVTSGDLRPDVSLYTGSGRSISSLNFDVANGRLEKSYQIESSGDYLVAIRAYRNEGSGKYKVTATCTGGPCNGELNDPTDFFSVDELTGCIEETRLCAFQKLPDYNGRVGASRAASIWGNCAENTGTNDGESCANACDSSEDAQALCDDIVKSLPFYADQTTECVADLNRCMDECTDAGQYGYNDGEIYEQPLAMCWVNGFNGNCDSFARQLPSCGGAVTNEAAFCNLECLSTWGVFSDDSSDLCDHCDRCGLECREQLYGDTFDYVDGLLGDVIDTFIGEVDPFVLGDVCITYVQVYRTTDDFQPGVYGLVEESTCTADDHRTMDVIKIDPAALEAITNADELSELNNMREGATFFRHNGDYEEIY